MAIHTVRSRPLSFRFPLPSTRAADANALPYTAITEYDVTDNK